MADDKTTLISTGESSSAGWAVAVIILLAVIAGGVYYWTTMRAPAEDTNDVNIDLTLPDYNNDPNKNVNP